MIEKSNELKSLYESRFNTNKDLDMKNKVWKTLCQHFFQRYIDEDNVIVDVASGYCEFINNIAAKKKFAIDLNPDCKKFANSDVQVINDDVNNIKNYLPAEGVDVFFLSNFLEHLDNKDEIHHLISILESNLNPQGKIIILQPNIKYVKKGRYWDFFDHKTPLTENSLMELAEMCNMKVIKCIPKFLPYTTKNAMPKGPFIIKLYLKLMPISNYFFGEQSFLIFEKQ